MTEINVSNEIMSIKTREQMIRYMDGYSAEWMEELDERKIRHPLVKSYMLEHVGDPGKVKRVTGGKSARPKKRPRKHGPG